MRAAGRLTGLVLQELKSLAQPGVTTIEIDRAAERMIAMLADSRPSRVTTAFRIPSALQLMSRLFTAFLRLQAQGRRHIFH